MSDAFFESTTTFCLSCHVASLLTDDTTASKHPLPPDDGGLVVIPRGNESPVGKEKPDCVLKGVFPYNFVTGRHTGRGCIVRAHTKQGVDLPRDCDACPSSLPEVGCRENRPPGRVVAACFDRNMAPLNYEVRDSGFQLAGHQPQQADATIGH